MKVLYVEDSAADADLARRALLRSAPELELQVATTLGMARGALAANGPFDVLLLDLGLPDGNGLELLAEIRHQDRVLPVVMLTGSGDHNAVAVAIRAGADDYLIKQGDYLKRLPARLAQAIRRTGDRSLAARCGLSVLYAEAHSGEAERLMRHLAAQAPHVRVDRVDSAAAVLARLRERGSRPDYDVLLFAFDLPDVDGLELLRRVRADLGVQQPAVLIAGQGNEALAESSLYFGLDAYLSRHEGFLYELTATLEQVHRQAQLAREESRLREVSGRLTRLLASSPTLLYSLALDGGDLRPVWVSDNIARVLGHAPACVMEAGWWIAHVHPDDRAAARAASARLLVKGLITHEYRFADGTGAYRWMRDEMRVVSKGEGEAVEIDAGGVVLRGGARVDAGLVVWAGGFAPQGPAVASELVRDGSGRLLVDASLQAVGHERIWVCGDAAAPPPGLGFARMGCALAMPMGAHAADNVVRALRGESIAAFRFGYAGQCISLGRKRGLVQLVTPEDAPRDRFVSGRMAALVKELISTLVIGALRVERLYAGAYSWPRSVEARQHTPALPASRAQVSVGG